MPSRVIAMPTGVISSGRNPFGSNLISPVTLFEAVSMMLTVPPISLVTQSSLRSGVSASRRGRSPTRMFAASLRVPASTTWTMWATSEVT